MRTEPLYRVYPWWPENGAAWVHPDDVSLARRLIPSTRVFRYLGRDGKFLVLSYGNLRLRVKPTLRLAIPGDDYDLGDQVEVCSRLGKVRPMVATIGDMRWNARVGMIHYRLRRRGMMLARQYAAEDLRPLPYAPLAKARTAADER